jgi:response regulator RpfG family c-di-GMP phosphodiesterase
MKKILCINVKIDQLREFKEILENHGLVDYQLIFCEDINHLPAIFQKDFIHCIVYEIGNSDLLTELEYLRLIAPDLPNIVFGKKVGRKDFIQIINSGLIFYFLEKPLKDYDFITAIDAAVSFHNSLVQKFKRIQKAYIEQQVDKLNNIGIALSSEHKIEKLLGKIVSQALVLAHCDAGSIYIKEGSMLTFMVAQNKTLRKRYGEGYEERFFKSFRFPITKDRISGYVAATGETLNIRDVYHIPPDKEYTFTADFDKRNNYVTKSMIIAPMRDQNNSILGVLQLINCLDGEGKIVPFDKHLESLIQSLASQAAVAIRNARLIKEVKEAHLDTIMRLSVAAEFRDDDTSDHLRRMTTYSVIVAKNLGMDESDIEMLKYAAPMHDIGKIGIPDSILFKPGSLSRSEWEEMKNHTIYGAQILEGSNSEILKASRVVALNHHERWDGGGYPNGLKNDSIPKFGQIVSIADVFDALASKRCYKEAYDLENATNEIRNCRNKMFGPRIIEAFMMGLDEIVEVFNYSQRRFLEEPTPSFDGSSIGAHLL